MTDLSDASCRGSCPDCGPNRWATVLWEHKREISAKPLRCESFRLLECRGCGAVYVQRSAWGGTPSRVEIDFQAESAIITYDETQSHWPSVQRPCPVWLPELAQRDQTLAQLAGEVYAALNAELRVLAAIGIRTAFDRAVGLLGVPERLPFGRKLDALASSQLIASNDRRALDALIDAGSAAAHRSWRPSPEQLATMMEIIETFLFRTFVLPDRSDTLRSAVPPRGQDTT